MSQPLNIPALQPPEIGRIAFDEWCWKRGLELRDVVAGLQSVADDINMAEGLALKAPSIETVRLVRLPFSDARRRVPAQDLMRLIVGFTAGEITPADFYPAHIGMAVTAEARG